MGVEEVGGEWRFRFLLALVDAASDMLWRIDSMVEKSFNAAVSADLAANETSGSGFALMEILLAAVSPFCSLMRASSSRSKV